MDSKKKLLRFKQTNLQRVFVLASLWLIVPKRFKNEQKGLNVRNFVQYVITQGQSQAEKLHYAPLPESIVQLDHKMLGGSESTPKPGASK